MSAEASGPNAARGRTWQAQVLPGGRREIVVEAGKLPEVVDEAEEALFDSDAGIYQRGGMLVRLCRYGPVTVRGIERPDGALLVTPVDSTWLVERLTASAGWQKWDKREKGLKPIDCPSEIARTLLARAGAWRFPALVAVVESPTLRPDGSILETPGYDKATGLFFEPGDCNFPPIPEAPTKDDAKAALDLALELLKEFPFVEKQHRSVAVSAILTALVRRSLAFAPLHGFNAPVMRSGKSMLCDLASLFATGRRAAVLSVSDDPKEEKKRLLALLIAGDPVVVFDNIEQPFGGAAISSILTQETYSDRILGESRTVSAPTSTFFLANGNNLTLAADVSVRSIICTIDPGVEHPEERTFETNLYEEVPRRRGELVTAALTILRAWHVAGMPHQGLPEWGGFEEWSRWVRGALVWLDMADPALTRTEIEVNDPVRQELLALLSAWWDAWGAAKTTTPQLVIVSGYENEKSKALRNAFVAIAGTPQGGINVRKLARFVAAHAGRFEGGMRIVRYGLSAENTVTWAIERRGGVS